jgi:hypothetical protein
MLIFFITVILIINIYFFQSLFLGLMFGFGYFFILSKKFNPKSNLIYSTLLVLSILSFSGAIVYFFYELNNAVIAIILITTPIIISKIPTRQLTDQFTIHNKFSILNNKFKKLLILIYLTLTFISFKLLLISQTTDAIRSPWGIIPSEFFIFYFLATVILIFIILSAKTKKPLFLISLHFLLSSSVALIIYKLGYGFDQFIHLATEKVIYETGAIFPKPFYYLGQYSLVIILAKMFSISHEWIDKLLTIILFSFFLPTIIYISFKKIDFQKNLSLLASLSFLIFPLSSFIVTTPQNLANLFILFTIFASLPYLFQKEKSLIPIIILTLTTLAIHPLAGIPLLIFLSLIILTNYRHTQTCKNSTSASFLQVLISVLVFCFSSIILPLIFLINSSLSGLQINLITLPKEQFFSFLYNLKPYFINNFNLAFDFAYFYKFNFYILTFLLSTVIFLLIYKKTKFFIPYFLSFIVIFLNFLILKLLFSFDFLIDYEQGAYTQRIFEISFYFLYPIILYGLIIFFTKLQKQKIYTKLFFILLLVSIVTSSFYASYPRDDDYEASHSFNATLSDIKTVQWIEQDAGKNDFIVLANQQVSVAGIQEYGFKKYYEDQFYYPIPTSSPLYEYYLKMVGDEPKKEYILEAMQSVGVKQGYFVLNEYWWRYRDLVKIAKKNSASYKVIDNGKNIIFKYTIN